MNNKILTLAITLTVGIILLGSLMMPIINDATNGKEVVYGNGSYYMSPLSGDHTLTVSSDGITLDGEDLDAPAGCWFYANELNIYSAFATKHIATPSGVIDISTTPYTITMTGNSATVSDGTDTETVDTTNAFVPTSEKSDYTYVRYNVEMHLNSTNDIILSNAYSNSHFYAVVSGVASVDGSETDVSISDNLVSIEGIDNVYTTSKIVVDKNGTTTTVGAGTVVPATVTGIVTGSDEGPEISLLLAIPVLVICGLVILAVRGFYNRD